jgi:hypothetical protein
MIGTRHARGGERLRVWREEVKRWSRAEFRDEVEAASYKIGESRGHKLDERLIARWETGAVARPQSVYCRILAHMDAPLPSSAEPIVPPSTVDVLETWGCRANLQMLCAEMGHAVERRLFLTQSGSALVVLANPWLLDPVDRVVDRSTGGESVTPRLPILSRLPLHGGGWTTR